MHIYTNEAKTIMLPSVTTITSFVKFKPEYEPLMQWSNFLGFKNQRYQETLDMTADLGTKVHEAIAYVVQDKDVPDELSKTVPLVDMVKYCMSVASFRQFYNDTKPETLFSERSMLSETLGYGGTIDWVSIEDKKTILTDFKTSSAVRGYMSMQLAAYIKLLEEKGISIDVARIMLVSKPKVVIREFTKKEMDKAYKMFQKVFELYKLYNEDIDEETPDENSLIIVK